MIDVGVFNAAQGNEGGDVTHPRLVKRLRGHSYARVAAGQQHTVTLSSAGLVSSCGHNGFGQLGKIRSKYLPLLPRSILVHQSLPKIHRTSLTCCDLPYPLHAEGLLKILFWIYFKIARDPPLCPKFRSLKVYKAHLTSHSHLPVQDCVSCQVN